MIKRRLAGSIAAPALVMIDSSIRGDIDDHGVWLTVIGSKERISCCGAMTLVRSSCSYAAGLEIT